MAKPPRCPIPGNRGVGEAHWPGSRTLGHRAPNSTKKHPVHAGQQICLGAIVTMRNGGIVRVEGAAESGDGVNWGDVSGGAFMALAPVDTT